MRIETCFKFERRYFELPLSYSDLNPLLLSVGSVGSPSSRIAAGNIPLTVVDLDDEVFDRDSIAGLPGAVAVDLLVGVNLGVVLANEFFDLFLNLRDAGDSIGVNDLLLRARDPAAVRAGLGFAPGIFEVAGRPKHHGREVRLDASTGGLPVLLDRQLERGPDILTARLSIVTDAGHLAPLKLSVCPHLRVHGVEHAIEGDSLLLDGRLKPDTVLRGLLFNEDVERLIVCVSLVGVVVNV